MAELLTGREQTWRDAEAAIRDESYDGVEWAYHCLALLTELEEAKWRAQCYCDDAVMNYRRAKQAERERDEALATLDSLQKGIT